MDTASIALTIALAAPAAAEPPDFDAPLQAARTQIDSPWIEEQVLVAMAWPYRYGVTRMPCRARVLQPLAGWRPSREPSGAVRWETGPTRVRWGGIYGTCVIESPVAAGALPDIERESLECICNGWLPHPVADIPLP